MAGRKHRIGFDTLKAATDGNMTAMGQILDAYMPNIEDAVKGMAPWATDETVKDCRQNISIGLINLILYDFRIGNKD